MQSSWWHYSGAFLLGILSGILFLQEPGFGDELTYWLRAFEMHQVGTHTWQTSSFHDLRWPIWGLCWVLQGIFGPGLVSFFGVPCLYLALGAVIAFVMGRVIFASVPLGWAAAIAFLLSPLIDGVVYRPMPDLSEAVFGGCAVLCWLGVMRASRPAIGWFFSLLTGLCLALLFSNRFSGLLMIPVLGVLTLVFYPRRFHWLALSIGFAGVFIVTEAFIYHRITGDWLHSIHANMGARGKKGTDTDPLWYLPFRFFDTLWKGNNISPVCSLLAALGAVMIWKKGNATGRVAVGWFFVLYFAYSCGLQSFNPPKPLVRDADRFLGSLAIPYAILIIGGLSTLWNKLPGLRWDWARKLPERVAAHPVWTGVICFVALSLVSSRPIFKLGYIRPMRAYMEALQPGTKVFTHDSMKGIAYLVGGGAAWKLDWSGGSRIMESQAGFEPVASAADEFWYCRKLAWRTAHDHLEQKKDRSDRALAAYFDVPEKQWSLTEVLIKGDTPDLVFYRRLPQGGSGPEEVRLAAIPEWVSVFPALPAKWESKRRFPPLVVKVPVPERLRGRKVRLDGIMRSNEVEALTALITFYKGDSQQAQYHCKPYFHPQDAKDFFAFEIPLQTDRCEIELWFASKTRRIAVSDLRLLVEAKRN